MVSLEARHSRIVCLITLSWLSQFWFPQSILKPPISSRQGQLINQTMTFLETLVSFVSIVAIALLVLTMMTAPPLGVIVLLAIAVAVMFRFLASRELRPSTELHPQPKPEPEPDQDGPEEERWMQVYLETLFARPAMISVVCYPSDKIQVLLDKLEEKTGIPSDSGAAKLIYAGRQLNPEWTFAQVGLCEKPLVIVEADS